MSLAPCSTPEEIVTSALRRHGLDPERFLVDEVAHDLRDASPAPLATTCGTDLFLAIALDNVKD